MHVHNVVSSDKLHVGDRVEFGIEAGDGKYDKAVDVRRCRKDALLNLRTIIVITARYVHFRRCFVGDSICRILLHGVCRRVLGAVIAIEV